MKFSANILGRFKLDLYPAVRGIDLRTYRKAASVVRYPDDHAALAFYEPVRTEYLGLDTEAPLFAEDGPLLFPRGNAYGNVINEARVANHDPESLTYFKR